MRFGDVLRSRRVRCRRPESRWSWAWCGWAAHWWRPRPAGSPDPDLQVRYRIRDNLDRLGEKKEEHGPWMGVVFRKVNQHDLSPIELLCVLKVIAIMDQWNLLVKVSLSVTYWRTAHTIASASLQAAPGGELVERPAMLLWRPTHTVRASTNCLLGTSDVRSLTKLWGEGKWRSTLQNLQYRFSHESWLTLSGAGVWRLNLGRGGVKNTPPLYIGVSTAIAPKIVPNLISRQD